MKAIVFLLLLLICCLPQNGLANTYYFSSSDGNDNRTASEAQSSYTPWQSLSKLNSIFPGLGNGDSVLFKKGDVFDGLIQLASKTFTTPVVFASYGNGMKPVISGLQLLDQWQQSANNIWTTGSYSGAMPQIVLMNNIERAIGRYPNTGASNKGYFNFENHTDNVSITDDQLNTSSNWTGAEVVIRKNRWVLDRNKISSINNKTINYISESGYYADNNYGYFFQNHPSALDLEGEWYFNGTNNTLGIYSTSSPAGMQVFASKTDQLIGLSYINNLRFYDLVFKGSNVNTIFLDHCQNISIINCDLDYAGTDAVKANASNGITIENSTIDHSHNIALNLQGNDGVTIRNNKIKNSGSIAGSGKGDSGSYEAIMIAGNNNLVELNSIDSTGYIPITFSGNSVIIRNNVITDFAFVKDDGGGIYTWNNGNNAPVNSNRVIEGNIVLNGSGAGAGTDHPDDLLAHGIYIDDNADHVTIVNNTVAHCSKFGLYLHNAKQIDVHGNTFFDNSKQSVMQHDNIAPNAPLRDITSSRNIFFSKTDQQAVAEFKTEWNDLMQFGSSDSNYYCRPIDDALTIATLEKVNSNFNYAMHDVEGWKTLSAKDLHSRRSPKLLKAYTINNITGSNQFGNGNFNDNAGGLYAYSGANNCTTSWNSGALDGGSLKVAFTSTSNAGNKASVVIGIGQVVQGQKYLLKFSTTGGNAGKYFEAFLRQSLSPYEDLSDRKESVMKGNRIEYEYLFTPTKTENNASIVLDIPEQASAIYFDNIKLYTVNAGITNPADSIVFRYNNTEQPKTYSLNGSFLDAKNSVFNNSITLAPFSSAVLIKADQPNILPVTFTNISAKPTTNTVNIRWELNSDETNLRYRLERSTDGKTFNVLIDTGVIKTNAAIYHAIDKDPASKTNYYRVKLISSNGAVIYSKIVTIKWKIITKQLSLKLSPVPASDQLHVSVSPELVGAGAELLVMNASGTLLKRLNVIEHEININISSLTAGNYILIYKGYEQTSNDKISSFFQKQ